VVGYIAHRIPKHGRRMRVQTEVPPVDSLGPGDVRVYNADSSVDMILQGEKVLVGLSPKTIAKVRQELDTSNAKDTSGGAFGASISQLVKKTVANAIGTHVVYPLADIRDVRYDNGRLVFDWTDGGQHQLFGKMNVNGRDVSNTFRSDEAQRFIDAVHARKSAR